MKDSNHNDNDADLKKELEDLRLQNAELLKKIEQKQLGGVVKDVLRFIDDAAVIGSFYRDRASLKLLLEMAGRVVKAEMASIILFDSNLEELYFEEATGEKAGEVKKFRLKPNEGIAGYCFSTGEAIAVSDVMKDSRFKRDIAQSLGQKQKALMAVPIIFSQEVIGVMEAINKIDGGTFSGEDLEIFSLIAHFAAFHVRKVSLYADFYSLFLTALKNVLFCNEPGEACVRDFLDLLETLNRERFLSEDFRRNVELASIVHHICETGTEEAELAASILRDVLGYIKEKRLLGNEHKTE